jgi:hypothetical protein
MQEQNFEKQVQKKLEELNLPPSAPVWKKVEEQIRKKKDRRRIFFWLIPLALLSGGTYFYSVSHKPGEKTTTTGITKQILKETNNQDTPVINSDGLATANDQSTVQKQATLLTADRSPSGNSIITETSIKKGSINKPATTRSVANRRNDKNDTSRNTIISVEEKARERSSIAGEKKMADSLTFIKKVPNNDAQVQDKEKNIANHSENPVDNASMIKGNIVADSFVKNNVIVDTINKAPSPSETKDTVAVASVNETDTIQKAQVKAKSKKRWNLSTSLAGGSSGIATSAFGNLSPGGAASLDAQRFYNAPTFAQTTGNGPIAAPSFPSDIKNAFSFAAGAGLSKGLSTRLQFATGLFYHLYSSSITVGKKVNQAETISRENKNIRVENFYLSSNSGETDTYKNKYHFIELPVGLEWQVVKAIPLQLQTGFSIGQLIGTNALHYDGQKGVYYEDEKLFKQTQFSFYTGLFYRILKINGASLYLGPKAQFQLSNLLKKKNFGEQHLYFGGIETYVSF